MSARESSDRPFLSNVLARLAVYYLFWIGLVAALYRLIPAIPLYIAQERGRHIQSLSGDLSPLNMPASVNVGIDELLDPAMLVPVASAMILSFALAVPVAWIYTWNRPQRRTVHGFAQTLVVVPIAISVVVFLVKGSLPLAFSLAGIVAAVRFRSNLEEPGDGVYLFMVIGIGLAAGVQLLAVATIGSMFFVLAQLLVRRTKILRDDIVMVGWHLQRVAPLEVEQVDPREATLRVHTTDVAQSLSMIASILETHTAIYSHVLERGPEPGVTVIRFDMRLQKKVKVKKIVAEIESAQVPGVTRVLVYPS